MINFYELFNLTKINFQQILLIIFLSLMAPIIIFDSIFDIFNLKKYQKNNFNKIFTIFTIIISIASTFLLIKTIKNEKKEKFYKIAKANKLNINYEKFISEKKKLNDFCSERKLYSKYEDNFCKIETGNIVNDVFNFSEDTINKDTVNKVFNELYSTSNNKNKTKNKAVEEAIKFIKENKIQIKVNNKK